SADVPVPISPQVLQPANAWLVSDAATLVAVYAGAAANKPSDGRFVIVRQNLAIGKQTQDTVDVAGSGLLKITSAPKGAAVETSAQRGKLRFRGSNGWAGVLDLATDRTRRRQVPKRRALIAVFGLTAVLPLGCGSSRQPARNAAQPCRTGDYALRLSTNGATGGIVGIVQIRSKAGTSCRLETQLRLTTEHADGSRVGQIDGNPTVFPLREHLSPSSVLVRDSIWRNWCGSAERFTFDATAGPGGAAMNGIAPPRCDDPHSPSRLRPLPAGEPTPAPRGPGQILAQPLPARPPGRTAGRARR